MISDGERQKELEPIWERGKEPLWAQMEDVEREKDERNQARKSGQEGKCLLI